MNRVCLVALVAVPALGLGLPLVRPAPAMASAGITYHFPSPPIASAGSIGPGQAVAFTLRVTNNGSPDPGGLVYLGYFQRGHVPGDSTTVPASQCSGVSQLPSDNTAIPCSADSRGLVVLTYHVPAQPPAQGAADWVAEGSPGATSHALDHYVYTTIYRFAPSTIAPSGSLAPSASVPVRITAEDGRNNAVLNANVYLSFKSASGGKAMVGTTALTATPALFIAGNAGSVQITYTAPPSLPTSGQDVVLVQDRSSSPTERNTDSYAFASSTPVVSVGDVTVVEGDQNPGIPARFTVTVSPVQPSPMTIQYRTLCGIGDKWCGEDFVQVPAAVSLTIPANTSSTSILVNQFAYIGTSGGETYTEGWFVQVSNPSIGVVGRSIGDGLLQPDVEGSTTALADLYTGSAGVLPCTDPGGVPLYFTVTLGASEASAVTFHYATADATAVGGTDYTAVSGTASIPAGHTSVVIAVTVLPHAPPTGNKTFTLTISNPTGGPAVSGGVGTGTLLGS